MSPTDLSETSLELQIMADLTGLDPAAIRAGSQVGEAVPTPYGDGNHWIVGNSHEFDRSLGIDTTQLLAFLEATQPEVAADLGATENGRRAFLQRLSTAILADGALAVLRKGLGYNQHTVRLYFPLPTPGNEVAATRFRQNRFSVTRQLRYSTEETGRALDLALFVNGLPVITFELKNTITSQTASDAIQQYMTVRKPSERIFRYGVCLAHFALDDQEAHFTTRLAGNDTRFLPFNKGRNGGAGNPPNPTGIRTAWLWRETLQRDSLANIIESFVQMVEERNPETKKKSKTLVFPRYHQLDVVRALVADAERHGPGRRYLIQHSAGSGKSNSIAWLAQHLVELGNDGKPIFDSVIVVTDRVILDDQIHRTMKGMANQAWTIGHAERSGDLRRLISDGKRVIITTVQKFPLIVDDIGDAHRDRAFAIIIDEAHSSQGGRAAGQMNAVLGAGPEGDDGDEAPSNEDRINALVDGRKMPANASYFAFTATPKNRTLELFGQKNAAGKPAPFHSYTMKQAIQEGFILDVLRHYTPVASYYHLVKTIDDDPEVDVRKAGRALRNHVESHEATIARKAKIIVDHFHSQVVNGGKIRGEARGLVATQSIRRAIDYWLAIERELAGRGNPWRTIVAFTGEHDIPEIGGAQTEASLNGFPSKEIPSRFKQRP